jgi:hypothetical protein
MSYSFIFGGKKAGIDMKKTHLGLVLAAAIGISLIIFYFGMTVTYYVFILYEKHRAFYNSGLTFLLITGLLFTIRSRRKRAKDKTMSGSYFL